MTVALDAAGTDLQFNSTAGATGVSYTGLTVGSGSNRALVVGIGFDASSDVSPVAVWDSGGSNQSMTSITSLVGSIGTIAIYLFGLVAPTSGNKTLKVTWTGTSSGYVNAISWTGVSQTGGTTSFNNPQTVQSAGSPIALTTTGASSDASVSAVMCEAGVHRTSSTYANSWISDSSGPSGNLYGNWELGVGSCSDVLDGSGRAVMAIVTVKAASGTHSLLRQSNFDGVSTGGSFFSNPLGRSMLGWVPSLIPTRKPAVYA